MEAITATYVQEDEDWTVSVSGLGKNLTGRAPGLIAARDHADQLVEKLGPQGRSTTVVHLLHGSALEFTSAYLTARLSRSEDAVPAQATDERRGQAGATPSEAEPKVPAEEPVPAEPAAAAAKPVVATPVKPQTPAIEVTSSANAPGTRPGDLSDLLNGVTVTVRKPVTPPAART
jgi:hypothetical protein